VKRSDNRKCSECETLVKQYESATARQLELERNLLVALESHDGDSVHSLHPEVQQAWELRASVRAALRNHERMHTFCMLSVAAGFSNAPSA
jgi:hypothetical protein